LKLQQTVSMLYFGQKFQVTYVSRSCLQATCDHENAIRESDYIYRGATFCWLQMATSVFKQEVPPYTTEQAMNIVS
jgi:hypothetical protein